MRLRSMKWGLILLPAMALSAVMLSAPWRADSHEKPNKSVVLQEVSTAQLRGMLHSIEKNQATHRLSYEDLCALARGYVKLGSLDKALVAFRSAIAIRGDDAQLLADYADAMAFSAGHSFQGEPSRILEKALEVDPINASALSLAGLAAFDRKDYPEAVKLWDRLLRTNPEGSAQATQVQRALREARRLAALEER